MGSENELTPEQKLKGALIFKYLQTGKIPQRKGLFKTLFYLAGESKSFGSILMTSSSTTLKRPLIDRTIEIKVIINFPEQLPKIISNLEDIFKKFLINFEINVREFSNYLTIYYSSANIQWALIDEELRQNHKDNITEQSGFPKIKNYQLCKTKSN
jgi:hypothetical protein